MSKIFFVAITHNTEQQCGLVLCHPSKNCILSPGGSLPQFGNHCLNL